MANAPAPGPSPADRTAWLAGRFAAPAQVAAPIPFAALTREAAR